MQPIVLESDRVVARLTPRGAELTSLVLKETGREYLWQGDPAWWSGRAPLLFPIVGRLRDDHYVWQGRRYALPQHGFARESDFDLMQSDRRCASFLLAEAGAWLDRFPQEFNLAVTWELDGATITARHDVFNPSTHDDLLFSLGAHPGFRWPLEEGRAQDEYRLVFEHSETCERLEVGSDGLLTGRRLPFFRDQNLLKLRSDLFRGGAIVLQGLRSETITFAASDEGPAVTLAAAGFPYFGIWSRPDAPFLCLEPWHGVADTAGADWDLRNKPGIVCLPPGESWTCRISITIR